jgi:hypothetical protein
MIEAHEMGTDNEGYETLVNYTETGYRPCVNKDYPPGLPLIGSDLPPIKFCPWCGTLTVPEERKP